MASYPENNSLRPTPTNASVRNDEAVLQADEEMTTIAKASGASNRQQASPAFSPSTNKSVNSVATPLFAPATTVASSSRVNGLLLRTPVVSSSTPVIATTVPQPYSRHGNPNPTTIGDGGAQLVAFAGSETPFVMASIGGDSNHPSGYVHFLNNNTSFNSNRMLQARLPPLGQSPSMAPADGAASLLATPMANGITVHNLDGQTASESRVGDSSFRIVPSVYGLATVMPSTPSMIAKQLNQNRNPLAKRGSFAGNSVIVPSGAATLPADNDAEFAHDDQRPQSAASSNATGSQTRNSMKHEGEPLHMSETVDQKRARLLAAHMEWVQTLSPYDPRRIFFTAFPEGLLPQGSIGGSAFNLATNTLGAGTIALPAAFSAAGGLFGFVVLLICLFAAIYAMRLQVLVTEYTGMKSYSQKARLLIGVWAEKFIAVIIIILSWGVTIVYVVSIGDLLDTFRLYDGAPEVFQGPWGRRLVTTGFWAIFMLPLSLPAQINSLRYASLAGLASTLMLVLSIIAYAATTTVTETVIDSEGNPHTLTQHLASTSNIPVANFDIGAVMAFPVFIFGTACHTNTYQVYSELTNKSPRRMTIVAIVTMTAVGILYLSCGLTGVAIFGDDTESNILSNFSDPLGQWYITIAFFGMAITLTAAFPLCVFPARDAVLGLFGIQSIEKCPKHVRIPLSGAIATTSLLVGLFVPGVTIMFGLLGGLLCSNVVYICPAIFALRSGLWNKESVGIGNIVATWALLIFGIIAAVFGTAVSIYGLV